MIAVIGGGASGLMAALTAAEHHSEVVLLERQPRVGRKLLSSGNGRCNLSNLHTAPAKYHGADTRFVEPALAAFGVEDTLAYFRSLGLLTVCEADGKIYPLSNQAGSVVDVLRLAAAGKGVMVRTDCQVTALCKSGQTFDIESAEGRLTADKVIICCGGLAGGKVGGSRGGYDLLQGLGHQCTKLYPALVQLKTDNTFVRALKGIRADAAITLLKDGRQIAWSKGEVQFTEYGVSGPAIFELSRAAAVSSGYLSLELDLLPGFTEEETASLLQQRQQTLPNLTFSNLLTGILHNRLGQTLLRYAGIDLQALIACLPRDKYCKIVEAIKHFMLPVTGTLGFANAQVTAGGIKTAEFNPQTLESRLVPGLYAAGEVLDIDGDCGGYNLQWAWASGRLAGGL